MANDYDIIIIGTGAGGGTLAYALRNSGKRILLIERGDYLPQEAENWSPNAVFKQRRYAAKELWKDQDGRTFSPGVYYFVGGSTKMFGAALPRLRREDFGVVEHAGGISPAWPVSYEDLEPYYTLAEQIYRVHGVSGYDPTEPSRSTPYPYPPIPHEPYIQALSDRLTAQGLHPFPMPMGIDLGQDRPCIRCKTCDGFPCKVHAKRDADISCVRPALENPNIEITTHTYARRLLTTSDGHHVTGVEVERDGQTFELQAATIVVSCGAVNSAALLLRSANSAHPNGLANSSGLVGRNYMVHNNTALIAVAPTRRNPTVFQKTIGINDFYWGDNDWPHPMGNLQLLGKLQAGMLTVNQPLVPRQILQSVADRSIDWWVMSEDLPDSENRVTLTSDGTIQLRWKPTNIEGHERLVKRTRAMLRRAGYPIIMTQRMTIETTSHQCGTICFGVEPENSVLDPLCRTHDIENLYVVDSSFFPSSSAVNPTLTIAAQTLRVADHMLGNLPSKNAFKSSIMEKTE